MLSNYYKYSVTAVKLIDVNVYDYLTKVYIKNRLRFTLSMNQRFAGNQYGFKQIVDVQKQNPDNPQNGRVLSLLLM